MSLTAILIVAAVIIVLTIVLIFILDRISRSGSIFRRKPWASKYFGGQFDAQRFNTSFVAARQLLYKAATAESPFPAMRELQRNEADAEYHMGVGILIDALAHAGERAKDLSLALHHLYSGLSPMSRSERRAPWNRDLRCYGDFTWNKTVTNRDVALSRAWIHIDAINRELKAIGLGFTY